MSRAVYSIHRIPIITTWSGSLRDTSSRAPVTGFFNEKRALMSLRNSDTFLKPFFQSCFLHAIELHSDLSVFMPQTRLTTLLTDLTALSVGQA